MTHLMAVCEALRLFTQLARDIINDSQPWQEPGRASPAQRLRCSYPSDTPFRQTYIQFRFGHEERYSTLDDFSHLLLRPSVEILVAVISRDLDHKKICGCRPILAVPDNWSGDHAVECALRPFRPGGANLIRFARAATGAPYTSIESSFLARK